MAPSLLLRRRVTACALGTVALALAAASCTSSPAPPSAQFSSPAAIRARANLLGGPLGPGVVSGTVRAPGGPFLYDSSGRVVFFHGVNAVYKYAPFELYPAPGKPWNFGPADARAIARLGFNVVRLGLVWQGLEPNGPGPNDPSICTPGRPVRRPLLDAAVATPYLDRLSRTVALLGRYHIYVLLDMHQDVYSQAFRGEGAPPWAVCTDNQPTVPLNGRWSRNYVHPSLATAESHFWLNDVVGNLQGQYDAAWALVARHFAHDPWILGYDPYNEPFSTKQVLSHDLEPFAIDLECFYTGRTRAGSFDEGDTTALPCPPDVPAVGVIPAIERADPHHLVFFEPDNYQVRNGGPSLVGRMPFPRLVYNFHVYCGPRSPVTGEPTDLLACVDQELANVSQRHLERPDMSTPQQPGGPAWFMSEFGASHNISMLEQMTRIADSFQVGWAYWSWKFYTDPTGSSDEPLARADGTLYPTAPTLSRAYPQAVAGTPVSISYHSGNDTLDFVYAPAHANPAPTVVFVPGSQYPKGYCAAVTGGTISSVAGDPHLQVQANADATTVTVVVRPGRCRAAR